MFGGASNLAEGVDNALIFIFSIAFIFIIGLTAFIIYIVIKFNRKKGKEAMQFSGNNKLEALWTIIPFFIVMAMFYVGWKGFAPMRKVPAGAMEIKATGRKWAWEFDYGNGKISDTLVVPLNRSVKLNLFSPDVNHSLFIPAFRIKEDVVPGYNNYMWFTPISLGEFDIFCAEYCGLDHSGMLSKVKVIPQEDYDNWLVNLKATGNIPEPEGLTIMKANNCLGCHSMDGSNIIGPSFKNLFDANKIVISDGKEKVIVADSNYILTSIVDPSRDVVKGFNKGLMQSYSTTLTDEDLTKIVHYLMSLDEKK
jgi:cytochrome c oxidase subunit II